MITRMVRFRSNEVLRLSTALAVLLLLAVQEKLCPWLAEDCAAAQAEPQSPAAPDPNSEEEEQPDALPPLSLAGVLPDAVPPRSSVDAGGVRLAPSKRRAAAILGSDDVDPGRAGSSLDRAAACTNIVDILLWPPLREARLPRAFGDVLVPRDPCLRTAISRTGPPIC
jgi:hypothetical protein